LDEQFDTKKDQMAAQCVVILPQCSESTETMGKVVVVGMTKGNTVKACGREDAIGEVMFKVSMFSEEGM
jgi:hypothetical protein